jgi:hypothetical protein
MNYVLATPYIAQPKTQEFNALVIKAWGSIASHTSIITCGTKVVSLPPYEQ